MSVRHALVGAAVVLGGRGRKWRSAAAMEHALARRSPERPPRALPGVAIEVAADAIGPIVRLIPPRAAGTVVALHGGGYLFGAQAQHWALWRRLAVATRRTVAAPLYPLAPAGTAATVVPWVAGLAASAPGPVVLLGDSAGGGIALASAQLLRERAVATPLVLAAPWLDATLEHPWTRERDPWLAVPGLRRAADLWRGDLPLDHPFLSPLLGDLAGLGPIVVASGTRDVLHEDARRLAQHAPGPVRLEVGEGLLHDYPLLPVPEARSAVRMFAAAIRDA